MTVLAEAADSSAPPSKRIRLCQTGGQPALTPYHPMATPIDAASPETSRNPLPIPVVEKKQSSLPPQQNDSVSFEQTAEYRFMLEMQERLNLGPWKLAPETPENPSFNVVEKTKSILPPQQKGPVPYEQCNEYKLLLAQKKLNCVMLNGYSGLVDNHKAHSPDDSSSNTEGSPVATLFNLGNTCFLNSVLYTLRFMPNFLHNLHHLATDLMELSGRYSHLKSKSSSLGRGIGGGSKSWSNKDLSTLGQGTTQEDKHALLTLRLHEVFEALHNAELKDHIESFHPDIFFTALREVNAIFEGNQQHDAHELLVCLLDQIRETCRQLNQLHERQRNIIPQPPPPTCPLPITKSSFSTNVRKSLKLGKAKSNGVHDKKIALNEGPLISDQALAQNEEEEPRVGHNFISEDFEGTMHLYTTCLECEKTSYRPEEFLDLCVPVTTPSGSCATPEEVNALYHSAIITEEYLQDTNKYWCENCGRHNEARRNVSFATLPRLLVLQIKRFSGSFGTTVQKITDYMPTPMWLSCFCKKCKDLEDSRKPHLGFQLYGIIMHLGSSVASGHYVSYVSARDTVADCANCTRDKRKTASLSGGAGKPAAHANVERHGLFRFFKSSKPTYPSGLDGRSPFYPPCRSADCCGIKLDTEPVWLDCDDENIKTISRKQLEELLSPKASKSGSSPYLLFYSRIQ